MMQEVGQEQVSFDPDARVLCADEACIGLVGEDGRCRVCGRPGLEEGGAAGEAADPAPPGAVGAEPEEEEEEEEGDFADRRLCADEACIGLVGEDGRCRVCGRPGD